MISYMISRLLIRTPCQTQAVVDNMNPTHLLHTDHHGWDMPRNPKLK